MGLTMRRYNDRFSFWTGRILMVPGGLFTVTDGNMEAQICNLVNGEASQCTRSAYFANFLADTVAGQKNLDMTFMSDVWNGLTSDQDCSGQPTHFNAHTQC